MSLNGIQHIYTEHVSNIQNTQTLVYIGVIKYSIYINTVYIYTYHICTATVNSDGWNESSALTSSQDRADISGTFLGSAHASYIP